MTLLCRPGSHQRHLRPLTRAALLVCLLSILTPAYAWQAQTSEYQLKAAFLFNFAKFVDWPSQAFSKRGCAVHPMCIDGDPFDGAFGSS